MEKAKTDPTKKILLSVADGPEHIELYTSDDEAVVDWSGQIPALYLTASTHDTYVKLGPFQLLKIKGVERVNSGDITELLKLAEAVVKSRCKPNNYLGDAPPSDNLVYVDADALQLLEDWIVNKFGEE